MKKVITTLVIVTSLAALFFLSQPESSPQQWYANQAIKRDLEKLCYEVIGAFDMDTDADDEIWTCWSAEFDENGEFDVDTHFMYSREDCEVWEILDDGTVGRVIPYPECNEAPRYY